MARLTRLLRSSVIEELSSDYVTFHRIKGVPERQILWRHVLRNAGLTSLTFVGIMTVGFLTGSVLVETVFVWPGIGRLLVEAIDFRDFAVIQGVTLLIGAAFIFGEPARRPALHRAEPEAEDRMTAPPDIAVHASAEPDRPPVARPPMWRRRRWRLRFGRDLSLLLLAIFVIAAIGAPWLTPHDPVDQRPGERSAAARVDGGGLVGAPAGHRQLRP